jgi:hypothetical protein
VTERYEEVRHATLLGGQTFRAELYHPDGQLSGGLDSVPNRTASRLLNPAADVKPFFKEERTRQMDQQDRQLMNAWKSGEAGRQTPPVIVEVAKGTSSVHSRAEESAFKERWQGVLNHPPPSGQS